ncbi:xanthine dehydrogenase accessory protein XdhC [Lacinutrix sp. C3R15]|uniref:xanthine dehydrogenase accessory protein XdhC n=1 Tax=Flavobacteriaceae TaxID=49546 RepID=UPI001C08CCBD|nr:MULTISPECIES: xanthine dehydrogenase accessory protein XdhC [Flavobacteriaceae]MBU2939158.1 xanthine dehydrogenase accessory protein XdhC [Lacinutrix sp. C3R15]MDO6622474.1 xanthine dehydrogenase accessory protein XdhC [Oceanihabitans sp. 1_MG-2023]
MQNWISLLAKFKEKQIPVALVTVTKCLGSTPCVVGSRMLVTADKQIHGTVGGGKLEFKAIDEAIIALNENRIIESSYTLGPEFEQCCGGKVEFIIEPMHQSPKLFLFGAGHIGMEICKLLIDTPFKVHLIDSRDNWFANLELDESITTHQTSETDFKTFKDAVQWGSNCYVLVLTHNHVIDFDIIAMALQNETKFLGLIGSKTKKVRFHNMLIKEMHIPEGMTNVVCPIGLDIGGDTPKEIAISVVAQLLQTHYKNE